MAALDQPVLADAHVDQHVAAEGLDQSQALSCIARLGAVGMNAAFRQTFQDLIDQPEALLDFADADPHPR